MRSGLFSIPAAKHDLLLRRLSVGHEASPGCSVGSRPRPRGPLPCRHAVSSLFRSAHRLLDQSDDDHDDRAADAAAGDLPDDRADIESASGCSALERRNQHCEQLAADASTDDAGDGVTDGSETEILEQTTGDVPAYRAADQLNNQS